MATSDEDERDNAKAAAREVEEETGWVPESIQFLCSFQPMVGAADAENLVFLARGAVDSGKAPDINEAASHSWFPIDVALGMVDDGQIVGAASVVGLSQTKLLLEQERSSQAAEAQLIHLTSKACYLEIARLRRQPHRQPLEVPNRSI